ncbi:flagellar basal body rod protein FlgB [Engelhardtia mirabilis]|uniref:Flagellar basal body rod protein FlgB n=1 Tax=Engelhardtia mirabilis TaxID=2528011 RepID=A0A518BSS4_9BACT|nr:Flagellar basal body rod protein FlgB [Planctomycetes bacterium Pla133]QDV04348.1 Flagellar basal body rod protein FlgB [Planctomycetes bacterium Pla86]
MRIGTEQNGMLMRLLDASVERDRVITSNIANINTPGYKRRQFKFEELVQRAMASGEDPKQVEPEITVDLQSEARIDGNNVVLEEEVSMQRENRLLYETYVTMLQGQLNLVDSAIRGTGN